MKNEAKTNQKIRTNLKKEREIEMHKNKQKNKQKKQIRFFSQRRRNRTSSENLLTKTSDIDSRSKTLNLQRH